MKRDKFDFDIGYITKSPCRDCDQRIFFPECADKCHLLSSIQTILAQGVSSFYSSAE